MDTPEILQHAKLFFFRGMLAGYASGAKPEKVPGMPGFKQHVFMDGDWKLLDRWCVHSETQKSFGTTTIWLAGQPIWTMTYGGYYLKEAIPCLKKALMDAYRREQFWGGRGMAEYALTRCSSTYYYLNEPKTITFSSFEGRESMREQHDSGVTYLGSHKYWGMALL